MRGEERENEQTAAALRGPKVFRMPAVLRVCLHVAVQHVRLQLVAVDTLRMAGLEGGEKEGKGFIQAPIRRNGNTPALMQLNAAVAFPHARVCPIHQLSSRDAMWRSIIAAYLESKLPRER